MIQEIWWGDSLDMMKNIKDGSVDMVLTDPPYGIDYADWDTLHNNTNAALSGESPAQKGTSFKRRGKPINGWSSSDRNIGKEYQTWCSLWLSEVYRVTKPCSPILIFNSRRFYHRLCSAMEDSGFHIKDMLIWEKHKANGKAQNVNHIPAIKKSGLMLSNYRVGNLKPMFEPIAFGTKPYSHTISECIISYQIGGFYSEGTDIRSNIFKFQSETGLHPTQKPVSLLETLIKTFTMENHMVLDCFSGSGSTLLAAKNLNRQYIGIENNKTFYDISVSRLHESNLFQ